MYQWADLYQVSKVSKRTNPEWHFKIFTFAGQRRLLELFSYGECNHLFISVTHLEKKRPMQISEFPSGKQQRNIFDRIDYPSM